MVSVVLKTIAGGVLVCVLSWFNTTKDTPSKLVYYDSINRDLKIKPIYECRCDEILQTKTKRFARLSYTGLVVELEHLEIKTRLTNEKFASVKGAPVTGKKN